MVPRLRREEPNVAFVAGTLTVGVFFGGIAGGVAFPTLPNLGPVLGISPLLVGVILSLNRFTRLLLNTPAGSVIDRLGTRRPMIVGFGVMSLAPFGYVVGLDPAPLPLSSASVFLISRALWGLGSAFVFVGAFSTITHVTDEENRGRWVGYMRGGQSLGFPTGLVVGGLVTDVYGYTTAFAVAGAAGVLATLVAAAVLPDVSPDVDRTAGLRAIPALVRRDPRIATVGAVNFVVRLLFAGVLLSTVVVYAEEHGIEIGGLSAVGASGLVMAVSVLFSSATTVVAGRGSDRLGNRALVTLPATGLLAGGFLVLAFVPTLRGAVAGVALIGVGVGGTTPPLLAYLGDISPATDTGKLGGVYNACGDLGSTIGPLIALPAADRFGFRAEYVACAALVALAGVLVAATLFGDAPAAAGEARESPGD